jgi:phosphoserine phosphatase
MDKKIKLIFFDMEGVIFETGIIEKRSKVASSFWTVIARSLGKEAGKEEDVGKDMWQRGEFKNYLDWMIYTITIHKKYGLNMKDFYDILHKVPFVDGAKETFAELHKRGYRTVIISGGFKNQANRAIRELGVEHVFAACEYFFDDKTGKLVGWNLLPCDYEGKIDFMELMMKEYKLNPKQCAFIGDGVNDIPLAKKVGLSIAFNGREELQKVTTHSVNQEKKDLRGILQYFP